jgi:hypothetical protein
LVSKDVIDNKAASSRRTPKRRPFPEKLIPRNTSDLSYDGCRPGPGSS